MTDAGSDTVPQEAPQKRLLPPHVVRRDFLPADMVAALLDFACDNESRFVASKVGLGPDGKVDPAARMSSLLIDFEPLKAQFDARIRPLAPILAAELRVPPFEAGRVELQLVAHGDGAFYRRHLDTGHGARAKTRPRLRLLSGVYYFHSAPKAFAGGALRLHEVMSQGPERHFLDIEPVHNSLVFFPSWMPHEVMPVSCPSGRFMDSRFAINCWFHGAVPSADRDQTA